MSAESMAEFYDAAEQIMSSSDDSEVCMLYGIIRHSFWYEICMLCAISVWHRRMLVQLCLTFSFECCP